MTQLKGPSRVSGSEGAVNQGLSACPDTRRYASLTSRLDRLSRLKSWCENLEEAMRFHPDRWLMEPYRRRLESCGRYLLFRHWMATGEWQLRAGNFCDVRGVCPCCSAARSRRLMGIFIPAVVSRLSYLQPYLLTLTWPPPESASRGPLRGIDALRVAYETDDLTRNLKVGLSAWSKLWARRKVRHSGALRDVSGAVLSVEVTRGNAGWHPHLHCVLLLPRGRRVEVSELREQWKAYTRGTQIRIDPVEPRELVEAFKYSVKLDETVNDKDGLVWRVIAAKALRGHRLVRGYGVLHSLKEPNLEEPEGQDAVGEWLEVLYAWSREASCYYQMQEGES